MGVVQNQENGGTRIILKSTDDKRVNVQLNEPVNAPLEGFIEVIGSVTGPDTIKCKEIITFKGRSDENAQEFDSNAYNMVVLFWSNCKDVYQMS